jgi:hypothetical protein
MGRDTSGARDNETQVRGWIKFIQDRGEMLDAVPQGRRGYAGAAIGLTPAGRTPTLPQLKSLSGPAPDPEDLKAGQDFAKAMSALLGR